MNIHKSGPITPGQGQPLNQSIHGPINLQVESVDYPKGPDVGERLVSLNNPDGITPRNLLSQIMKVHGYKIDLDIMDDPEINVPFNQYKFVIPYGQPRPTHDPGGEKASHSIIAISEAMWTAAGNRSICSFTDKTGKAWQHWLRGKEFPAGSGNPCRGVISNDDKIYSSHSPNVWSLLMVLDRPDSGVPILDAWVRKS